MFGFPKRLEWRFPAGLRPGGFIAPTAGRHSILVANADGTLAAYASDGSQIWSVKGKPPLVADARNRIFAISGDGNQIILVDPTQGSTTPVGDKPRFAPLNNAAMATFSTSKGDFLLLVIPEWDSIACYAVSK